MKKLRSSLTNLPEYYLLVLAFLAGYTLPFAVNPLSIILIVILILQIIFKNQTTRIIIACFFMLINIYMILALITEFREFPDFNYGAKKLLFGGTVIIAANLVAAVAMLFKYKSGLRNLFLMPQ